MMQLTAGASRPRRKTKPLVLPSYSSESEEEIPEQLPVKVIKTKKAKTQKPQLPFRFLELPGEMRNMVYEYLLVDHNWTIGITSSGGSVIRKFLTKHDYLSQDEREGRDARPTAKEKEHQHLLRKWYLNGRLYPSLLRVCKAVYAEAMPYLYNKNHFVFHNEPAVSDFLVVIGKGIEYIETLSLTSFTSAFSERGRQRAGFNKLTKATKLQTLILEEPYLKSIHNFFQYRIGRGMGEGALWANRFYKFAHAFLWVAATRLGGFDKAIALIVFPHEFKGVGGRVRQPKIVTNNSGAYWGRMWSREDQKQFRKQLRTLMED
jgi:hypothetical protein